MIAQSLTVRDFYDDAGQLYRVLDSTGTLIQYTYDLSGNITAVTRSTVPLNQLSILNVVPTSAAAGATMTIQGQNFSTTAAGDLVQIGGVTATVISATSTTLVVNVPVNSTGGVVSVTVGGVTATSSNPETIIPVPIITSIQPRAIQAGTTANVTVSGANLTAATFSIPGSGITIVSQTAAPNGASAVVLLSAGATANGRFALVGTNSGGSSQAGITPANALSAFVNPALDPDGDGLPNGLELILGTDPLNADSDGDGFADGIEVASISNPLDPNSTPLNSRLSGDAESVTLGLQNSALVGGANVESDSISFGVVNSGATSTGPVESDSINFTTLNVVPSTPTPIEADSLPVSARNSSPLQNSPAEADTVPYSVCQTTGACSGYSGLSLTSGLRPGIGPPSRNDPSGNVAHGPMSGQPFTVVGIAPAQNATRIWPGSVVSIAFSAPLDPASITSSGFSLSAEGQPLTSAIRYSADFRTVTLIAPLPPDTSVTVRLSDHLQDIWGRTLGSFQSDFRTGAAAPGTLRGVRQYPPGGATGVDSNTAIRLVLENAMGPSPSVAGLLVTEDGDHVEGTQRINQAAREIEFVPSVPFRLGAVIRVSVDSVDNARAEPGVRYEGLFTTAPAEGPVAELVRVTPATSAGAPLNAVMEFEYSQPLDRSALTGITASVNEAGTTDGLAAALSLRGDRIVRVSPSVPLSPGLAYSLAVSGRLQDTTGRNISEIRRVVTAGQEPISGVPRIVAMTPAEGNADVDRTAEFHIVLDRPLNPLTLDGNSIRLTADLGRVDVSISVAADGSEIIVTPLMPLRESSQVELTLVGVEDLAGAVLPSSTVRFEVSKSRRAAAVPVAENMRVRRKGTIRRRFMLVLIGRR